jgi:hypothetical protein
MTHDQAGISVVLITDRWETIERVVDCLQAQTVRHLVELVVVAPRSQPIDSHLPELNDFAAVRLVEVDSIHEFAAARAAGVRATTAPVVVLGETHSYPHPGWAEALIEAHRQRWGAVSPGFGNANPTSALSWAIFLLDYGRWIAALPAGEIALSPIHNGAYRRDLLLALGPEMETALSHGDRLSLHLHTSGFRSYFQPAARIDHLNISQPLAWLGERFVFGLQIAGQRAARWPWHRRLLYLLGSPLIPVVILARIAPGVNRIRKDVALPLGTIPALVLGAVVSTLGEALGYARGAGLRSELQMMEYELHKARYADPIVDRTAASPASLPV